MRYKFIGRSDIYIKHIKLSSIFFLLLVYRLQYYYKRPNTHKEQRIQSAHSGLYFYPYLFPVISHTHLGCYLSIFTQMKSQEIRVQHDYQHKSVANNPCQYDTHKTPIFMDYAYTQRCLHFLNKKLKNVVNRDFTLRFSTNVLNFGEK